MNTNITLLSTAEQLFDRHGFTATGMDRLAQAANMSSRTLYKHAGSKTRLIAHVLAQRNQRFLEQLNTATVDALFAALERWIAQDGSRGCLFLRALAETGGDIAEISEVALTHKAQLSQRIRHIIRLELGNDNNERLAEALLILIEGATAAAVYRGPEAAVTARELAALLMARVRA